MEESQQYQVCQQLLENGYTVYVEQCDLIPDETIKRLDQRFGKSIQFVRREDLDQQNIKYFEVKIQ